MTSQRIRYFSPYFLLLLGILFMGSATYAASLSIKPSNSSSSYKPAVPADCGLLWRVVPSPNVTTDNNTLIDVVALAEDNAWAIGYYTELVSGTSYTRAMSQHWNGSAWTLVTVPLPGLRSQLNSISTVSATDIWAVGTYFQTDTQTNTFIAHWDGSAWTQVSSPNFGSTNTLTAVHAIDSGAAWAVGGSASPGSGYSTMVLFWDGTTWARITSPNPGTASNFLRNVAANSVDDMWAVGQTRDEEGYTQNLTLHCSRLGCEETISPNTGEGNNYLLSVTALSSNEVWAAGLAEITIDPQSVLPSTLRWDGVGWTMLPTPPVPPDSDTSRFTDIKVISANDLWAVGNSVVISSNTVRTLIEHWDGTAWSISASPNLSSSDYFLGLSVLAPDYIWAVGAYATDGVHTRTLVQRYHEPCTTTPDPTETPTETPTADPSAEPTDTATEEPTIDPSVEPTETPTESPIPTEEPSPTPGGCTIEFSDVPLDSTFYSYVHCLACQGIIDGYPDGTFRPGNNVTRGQLAKIVSNAAGFAEPHSEQTFEDVAPGSTFHEFVERLASRDMVGGYACGNPEPCVPPNNLAYYRPNANVTRGQSAKIVASAALLPAPPSGQQTFEDAPDNSTFWQWIESLASTGAVGGYACGNPEPCVPPNNLPYFRTSSNVTRGQSAKIVSNTFFPACSVR